MHPRLHVCTSVRSHRCVHGDVVCACTPVCLRLPTAVSAEPGACQQVPGGAVQGVPWGDGSRSHPIPAHGAAPSGSPRPQGSPLGGAVGPQTGARIGTQTALGGLCCWGWHSSRHGAGDDGTRGPWGHQVGMAPWVGLGPVSPQTQSKGVCLGAKCLNPTGPPSTHSTASPCRPRPRAWHRAHSTASKGQQGPCPSHTPRSSSCCPMGPHTSPTQRYLRDYRDALLCPRPCQVAACPGAAFLT